MQLVGQKEMQKCGNLDVNAKGLIRKGRVTPGGGWTRKKISLTNFRSAAPDFLYFYPLRVPSSPGTQTLLKQPPDIP